MSGRTKLAPDAIALCEQALAIRHRDPDAALALAQQAAEAATSAGAAPDARRRSLAALGGCLLMFPPEVLRGREHLEQALRECVEAGDEGLRCVVLNELGENYTATSEFARGMQLLHQALELSRRLGHQAEEVKALRLLGAALTGTGDFVQALSLLLEALEIHEATSGEHAAARDAAARWDRGTLFARIAIVYSNMDQFQQAISYYEVALECFAEHYPRRAARTLYSMGVTAEEMKDVGTAESCFRRSFTLHQEHGDASGMALSQLGIAMTLRTRGELA
ncbi:MAG TPA: tetratricopeptide repeat protein, partial [Longimicrobiaceae bacterium]|nr:tetratricopeptide repeat protein [Longimicrobiaceae bacterium]